MSEHTKQRIAKVSGDSGHWHRMPNWVSDVLICDLTDYPSSALRVFLFLWRKTVGWNKTVDQISLSQIVKGSGVSKKKVIQALKLNARFYTPLRWAMVQSAGGIRYNGFQYTLECAMAKREVSPEQFAEELEKHLLGTEGKWDWDDTTSIALADERLERIRLGLTKFDLLTRTTNREELEGIIAALRRGEFPEIA